MPPCQRDPEGPMPQEYRDIIEAFAEEAEESGHRERSRSQSLLLCSKQVQNSC